jgi:hypothetical protein
VLGVRNMIREISAYVYETTRRHIPVHVILTPWRRDLVENLTVAQLVRKFPAFDGIQTSLLCFLFERLYRASFVILYSDQPMHN